MYTTRDWLKTELLDNADNIRQQPYIEDALSQWADSITPVYYSDTIKDWVEMPSEYMDRWKELGYDANRNEGGILDLMAVDVWFYYDNLTREVWAEIESEAANAEV